MDNCMTQEEEHIKLSFTFDELRSVKREITKRSYSDRISLGFVARLLILRQEFNEDHFVMDELDYLEGLIRIPGEGLGLDS